MLLFYWQDHILFVISFKMLIMAYILLRGVWGWVCLCLCWLQNCKLCPKSHQEPWIMITSLRALVSLMAWVGFALRFHFGEIRTQEYKLLNICAISICSDFCTVILLCMRRAYHCCFFPSKLLSSRHLSLFCLCQ